MKDMKEDYLWDRSGNPDPELQKLEEILGTLRYQPQPLRIPADIQIGRRRVFFPALAIAAAIALFAVLLSLWFHSTDRRPHRRWKRDETRKLSKNQSRPHPTSHQPKEFRKPLHQRARGTIESPLSAISSLPGGRLSFAEIPANRS